MTSQQAAVGVGLDLGERETETGPSLTHKTRAFLEDLDQQESPLARNHLEQHAIFQSS